MAKEKAVPRPTPVEVGGGLADKLRAAELAVAAVEKKYGKGAVLQLGKRTNIKVACIPTGIYGFDKHVVQAGGFPRRRITEVFGPESSGKTTIALTAVAAAQKAGGLAAYVDAEHSIDPEYARKLGVDVDNLFFSQPDSGEEALDIVETLVRSGAYDVIVVDSVAALVPQAELDGEMTDANVGLQARLMSKAMRKLRGIVNETNTCLIFINQIREKIGVMFGNPEVTTGGRALKFYASLRIDIRRTAVNKEGDMPVSNEVKLKAVKNKVGNPFRECIVTLEYGKGFNAIGSYLDAAVERGIVDKSGAWYSYKSERIGQGRDNAVETLSLNPEMYAEIKKAVEATDVTVEG